MKVVLQCTLVVKLLRWRYKMKMFVTAVCFLFLLKLKWPKSKKSCDVAQSPLLKMNSMSLILEMCFTRAGKRRLFSRIQEQNAVLIFLWLTTEREYIIFRTHHNLRSVDIVPGHLDYC